MRVLIQRVSSASVTVEGRVRGAIGKGLLVFLGVGKSDSKAQADFLSEKIVHLRVFPDEDGRMNRSLLEEGGALLVISQFTLFGDVKKGRRPSFDGAAPPEAARVLYEYFVESARTKGVEVQTGVFQTHMDVSLVNDGPITIYHEAL